MGLTREEKERYARQIILPSIGETGQERLREARVLVVGAGGLGSPALLYLAAAGVGTIGVADPDTVEVSNLHRQVLHGEEKAGRPKTESAAARLASLNSTVSIRRHDSRVCAANALAVIRDYDIVVDGCDNFPTRYVVNDACVVLGKTLVYGAIDRFEGQASVFAPSRGGPCYRCLFPELPPPGLVPSCAEAGVMGVLPGLIGLVQATEAIKLILGIGEPLLGRLLLYDALAMRFREVAVRRNPKCPLCGVTPSITELTDYEHYCGGSAVNTSIPQVTCQELASRLERQDFTLVDVRNPDETERGMIAGAIAIPLPEFARRIEELRPFADRDIIVYCERGGRSQAACEMLAAAGFQRVMNLSGGHAAWRSRQEAP
ncbi:MAG: molybdopterin-synthase adenylyltransferase MoeB [Candidatus Sumerlaeaceae bacterium]|nr:molybdopterin-synthase adenylyltransferase MoeB [Candidatus Sumerlaeaceae bacterium]